MATAPAPIPAAPGLKPASQEERFKYGRDARKHISRNSLAKVHSHQRGFDPIELLLTSHEGRIPKLLPVKYQRMSASPFAFFRGAVPIMAADLASMPHTGITVQLCGDAHVQNLGCFEGPDGRLVFDINDFDETIEGPWEWDIKRMAASIVLAGLESDHTRPECAKAAEAFVQTYCQSILLLADQPILMAARHQIRRARKSQAVSAALQQAERASPLQLLAKYTEATPRGKLRFKNIPHALWPVKGEHRQAALDCLPVYCESIAPDRLHLFEFFKPLDVGFKVVGTGSVALRDFVVLMEGNGRKDPLFLQIKQEVHSAYAGHLQNSSYAHQGRRVVEGQRKIQPLSDPLLGWTRISEHDYLVRQLNDHKGSVSLENLRGNGLASLGAIAGELLARGHARSGDALQLKGYIGEPEKVVKAIARYGLDYADLTKRDFETFTRAITQGHIKVQPLDGKLV